MSQDDQIGDNLDVRGSGAAASDGGIAAGKRAFAAGDVRQSPVVTGDHNVVSVTYQGTEVTIPSSRAIADHRLALRDRLEREALARWGAMSVYIQEEGATLPIEASPYQTGRLGLRQSLLSTLHEAGRLLILGEPGSGKTVALERLAWELCNGPEPTVPVLVRLFLYAGTPLAEWVRALLQETGYLRLDEEWTLAAFLKEGAVRCFFLFDGLNEVAPPYRDRLVDELVRWRASYPHHPLVLTSRPQDELWRRFRTEVRLTVMVQPIAVELVRGYLVAHLGPEKAGSLYSRLDKRLQEMAQRPLILWLIKEAGAAGESLPGNRGELYARFVSRMLRRDTDRRMDVEIPERTKQQALTDLAYQLGLDQRLSCPRDEAMAVVARRLGEEQASRVIGACARHGLLAGEETVWFAPHQTVQEHFAALTLREIAGQERSMGWQARAWRGWRHLLTGQVEGLARLAPEEWWTEAFVQLAGLTDNADWLVREITGVNPWLAWWCTEEGREVTEETRNLVADRSVHLLESNRVLDRRRAVVVLTRMRNERAVEILFRAAADKDAEIVGLAVQALLGMGEVVRTRALELAQQPEHVLHWSGLACLAALLDQPVVWVPPGTFLMGSDKARDPQAIGDELPQHGVELPGYWIGQYPVTVARFRAFVRESEYQPVNRPGWGGRDDHPVTSVTWHDALAYCRWLTAKSGLPVMLPSEAEWEKAARGTDKRIYPWGDDLPNESLCNFRHKAGQTTPVGQYSPRGDSPYGCADMAGNVWDWTRSLHMPYPYDATDGREDLRSEDSRVVRGGSFLDQVRLLRCAVRYRNRPANWSWYIGFRVVVCPGSRSDL